MTRRGRHLQRFQRAPIPSRHTSVDITIQMCICRCGFLHQLFLAHPHSPPTRRLSSQHPPNCISHPQTLYFFSTCYHCDFILLLKTDFIFRAVLIHNKIDIYFFLDVSPPYTSSWTSVQQTKCSSDSSHRLACGPTWRGPSKQYTNTEGKERQGGDVTAWAQHLCEP